jgi:signal transduction histidine kinase
MKKNSLITKEAEELNEALFDLLKGQSKIVVVSVFIMVVICAYLAHDSVPTLYILVWACGLFIATLVRFSAINNLVPKVIPDGVKQYKFILISSAIAGLAHASTLLFFPDLTVSERAIQSLLHVGFTTATIFSNGGEPRLFCAFSLPVTIALVLAWITVPIPGIDRIVGVGLGILGIITFIFQLSLAKSWWSFFTHKTLYHYQLDEALNKAKVANESRTRFLAHASHDLRQPMHVLSLYSGLLKMQDLDADTRKIVDSMGSSIDSLKDHMDNLLDVSKLDSNLVQATQAIFDIKSYIKRVGSEFIAIAKKPDLQFILKLPELSCSAYTDGQLLDRVVRNLIENAVRYTESGVITVSLEAYNKSHWALIIKDTGAGIPKEFQQEMFVEFKRGNNSKSSSNGLGLGLSIVHRLTHILGIDLEFQSEVGHGTEFRLLIERIADETFDATENEQHKVFDLSGIRVLCLDDDETILDAHSRLLKSMGAEVQLARSYDEALDAHRRYKPHLLIADYRLNESRTGLDLIEEVCENQSAYRAILLSGDTVPEVLLRAKELNVPLVNKPATIEKLKQEIERLDLN